MHKFLVILGIICFLMGCDGNYQPRPEGFFRIDLPHNAYQKFEAPCPMGFEYSLYAKVKLDSNSCNSKLYYERMKSHLDINYIPVQNNLIDLIKNTERLTYEHTVKTTYIKPEEFKNAKNKVYGTLYELGGNSAINYQFYLTDSVKHFVYGSIFFNAEPNKDSLAPAIDYMKKDVRHLMESFYWK